MQGRDRGEGQAAQWVADSTQRGREEKSKKPEGRNMPRTPQGMPARAPPVLDECQGLGWPPTRHLSLGFSRQWSRPSVACLAITEYTRATDTSGSLRSTALHGTTGLTTNTGRRTQRCSKPMRSLPVLFPGQSTSAELRASSRGRERARIPGN